MAADVCLNPCEGQANWAAGQLHPPVTKTPHGLVVDDRVEGSGGNDVGDDEVLSDEVADVEMQLEMEVLDFHHFHC